MNTDWQRDSTTHSAHYCTTKRRRRRGYQTFRSAKKSRFVWSDEYNNVHVRLYSTRFALLICTVKPTNWYVLNTTRYRSLPCTSTKDYSLSNAQRGTPLRKWASRQSVAASRGENVGPQINPQSRTHMRYVCVSYVLIVYSSSRAVYKASANVWRDVSVPWL